MNASQGMGLGKGVLLAGLVVAGCSDQHAKNIGQVTETGAKAGAVALQQAAQVLGRGVQTVKQGLSEAELSGKVHARILWDKPLANSQCSIDAEPGGIVKLAGQVETEELHRRLIDLVSNTTGVREVVDGIQIGRATPRDDRNTQGSRPLNTASNRERDEFVPRR